MSEPLRMTVVYEQDEDGWIVASIPAEPGAHSQGGTKDERGRTSSTPCA